MKLRHHVICLGLAVGSAAGSAYGTATVLLEEFSRKHSFIVVQRSDAEYLAHEALKKRLADGSARTK